MEDIQETIKKLEKNINYRKNISYFQIFHIYFKVDGKMKKQIKTILEEMPSSVSNILSLTRNLDMNFLEEFEQKINWDLKAQYHSLSRDHREDNNSATAMDLITNIIRKPTRPMKLSAARRTTLCTSGPLTSTTSTPSVSSSITAPAPILLQATTCMVTRPEADQGAREE
jgi:hypothetical protein